MRSNKTQREAFPWSGKFDLGVLASISSFRGTKKIKEKYIKKRKKYNIMLEKTISSDKKFEYRQWDSQIIFACYSPFASYFSMINHFFSLLFWNVSVFRGGNVRVGDLTRRWFLEQWEALNIYDTWKFDENWFEGGNIEKNIIIYLLWSSWSFN